MKELNDSERLEVAMWLLSEEQVVEYAERCKELELDCERNGFHNVPAECEDRECAGCQLTDLARNLVDCPYLDESEVTND